MASDTYDRLGLAFHPEMIAPGHYMVPSEQYVSSQWVDIGMMDGYANATLQSPRSNPDHFVVKKIVEIPGFSNDSPGSLPREMEVLRHLGGCNRIVMPLNYLHGQPTVSQGAIIFPHFPIGNLVEWRRTICVHQNFAPVPEAYIWRMLIQMTQALGFLHNAFDGIPLRQSHSGTAHEAVIHCNIMPKNVVVVPTGTNYPSFMLKDFSLAKPHTEETAITPMYAGSFAWQPEEHPFIINPASDIFSMGALVYFLATGACPVRSSHLREYKEKSRAVFEGEDPPNALENYADVESFYMANCPRYFDSIDLTPQDQRSFSVARPLSNQVFPIYNATYSSELNKWMTRCMATDADNRATLDELFINMMPEAVEKLLSLAGYDGLVDLQMQITRR